ncbi:UvrB/UvrC motif-containing protein, partial [Shewanella sp. 0m-11]
TPKGVIKKITDVMDVGGHEYVDSERGVAEIEGEYHVAKPADISHDIDRLEKQMHEHAKNLEFEEAAAIRDKVSRLREQFIKA